MTPESPFFLAKVECPVCKTVNEFETIKVGAYNESDRDTDFCPTGRVWRNPRYQAYNPLLFFTATCTNCFYTREFTREFKEWKSDSYFKTYRQKIVKDLHLNLLSEPDSLVRFIGEKLDAKRYPNETAIMKLILAIIDESVMDKRSDLDLGRFYLRIAWLFRDMERTEPSDQQTVKGYLIETDNLVVRLRGSLENARLNLTGLEQVLARQFEDETVPPELKAILEPFKDKYETEIQSILEMIQAMEGKIDSLGTINDEHKETALGSGNENTPAGFFDYRTFYEFLAKLYQKWDGIPQTERAALEYAADYYKKAFQDGRAISEGNQQLQASYLIAELSRRIGKYEQAKEYFNTTIRDGQELIYRNKGDRSKTALARRILELAIEQARTSMAEAKV